MKSVKCKFAYSVEQTIKRIIYNFLESITDIVVFSINKIPAQK